MLRHPLKKKLMADRTWKQCYVRIRDNNLYIFNSKSDSKPFQEILLQATYSLSDATLQAYDAYGKLHTVKLQVVQYKERVGIRPGQITRLVEGKKPLKKLLRKSNYFYRLFQCPNQKV